MSNPFLLSVPYCFYQASLFVHGAEYLFIYPFIHPANLSHSSPHPHFKGVQTIYLFFSHGPCLTFIQTTGHTSVLTTCVAKTLVWPAFSYKKFLVKIQIFGPLPLPHFLQIIKFFSKRN